MNSHHILAACDNQAGVSSAATDSAPSHPVAVVAPPSDLLDGAVRTRGEWLDGMHAKGRPGAIVCSFNGSGRLSGSVGVCSVSDLEYVHGLGVIVEAVHDAELTPSCRPAAFELALQRLASPPRVRSEAAEDERDQRLGDSGRDRL